MCRSNAGTRLLSGTADSKQQVQRFRPLGNVNAEASAGSSLKCKRLIQNQAARHYQPCAHLSFKSSMSKMRI